MAISITPAESPRPVTSSSPPFSSPVSSPSPSPSTDAAAAAAADQHAMKPSGGSSGIDFSPPLIAMVIVIVTAFLIVTYSRQISRHITTPILNRFRQWRRRRRSRSHNASSISDIESPEFSNSNFYEPSDGYHIFSPYGLDDNVIKTIPLSIYDAAKFNEKKQSFAAEVNRDCAVCLLEFDQNDYVRTLPICSHAFHVDCIDIWLRSHANCPLCRARIFRPESPFQPLMAGRIRPSLDGILESILLEPLTEIEPESLPEPSREITIVSDDVIQQDLNFNRRRLLLKRSYSFGFERNFQSERLVLDPATTSPWRCRRGSFWTRRLSPFGTLTKSRVFSFRSNRLTKSPFLLRRRVGLFEASSRRSKAIMASPAAGFSSSRLRCGDPEALLSPERYSRR